MKHDPARRRGPRFAPLLLLLLASPPSGAAETGEWRYCGPPPSPGTAPPAPADQAVHFTADRAEAEGDLYRLRGNVLGQRPGETLWAERIDYHADSDSIAAEGNLRLSRDRLLLWGDQAELDLANDHGKLSNARFWLSDRHLRGRAETLWLEGPQRLRLAHTLFTTCDEGDHFWRIKAARLRLDRAENLGVAYHARLELMRVPVFYTPYLSFPLEGRKSGLLVPTIGDSNRSGTEYSQPVYLNLAPDRDATITPHYFSRRGILWEGEFRYLNARNSGQITYYTLGGDRVTGADRTALDFAHSGEPLTGWRSDLLFRRVSDSEFLYDFNSRLGSPTLTHLERHGDLSYAGESWSGGLRVQDYQTLDPSIPVLARPYARLPQMTLALDQQPLLGPLAADARAEWVRFARDEGVTGKRLDLQPGIALPLEADAGFLTPRVGLRYTQYQLQHQQGDAGLVRSQPVLSLDSGLFFERELQGRARLQTVEPRLFYLYVPYRDQQRLIVDENGGSRVFDSGLPLFSFDRLFRDNRFTGADRMADANQLSAALTTRFLDDGGRELARAAVGRIFYFRDREVTLPGQAAETAPVSNWLGEVSTHWISSLRSKLDLEWDEREQRLERGNLSLRFHPAPRSAVNVAYRYQWNLLEQSDVSFMWPLMHGVSLLGRHRYSVRDALLLERVLGFEYASCCWTLRFLERRNRIDVTDEKVNRTLWLQLELKGLSSVGRDVETLLERDILAP